MELTAAELLKIYALLHDTVCHGTLDDLKSILAATPKSVLAQLKFNHSREMRTAILNSAIVRQYCQLHDELDYDNTVEVPVGRDLARCKQFYDAVKLLLDHGFSPDDIGPGVHDCRPIRISPVQLAAETDDPEILRCSWTLGRIRKVTITMTLAFGRTVMFPDHRCNQPRRMEASLH
jgi:hypothetical protein